VDLIEHNRAAWNREARAGSEWSTPVSPEQLQAAREGRWSVILTPTRPVPGDWFGALSGRRVLCLASGGGQQAPILAAAGAEVVSFDLSDEQLRKDREIAERERLPLVTVRGDMRDLSAFGAAGFDLIFHPVSNVFVPAVEPVWRECFRVLKPGGALLAGFMNPWMFLFDHDEALGGGPLCVKHRLPYAEPDSLDAEARRVWQDSGRAAEFSHSLEAQIGGQLSAGFRLTALYEDHWTDQATPLNRYAPLALATRAVKP
jgi:SAM-dependent methyltransferase